MITISYMTSVNTNSDQIMALKTKDKSDVEGLALPEKICLFHFVLKSLQDALVQKRCIPTVSKALRFQHLYCSKPELPSLLFPLPIGAQTIIVMPYKPYSEGF